MASFAQFKLAALKDYQAAYRAAPSPGFEKDFFTRWYRPAMQAWPASVPPPADPQPGGS